MAATTNNGQRFESSFPPSIPQQHPWLVITHGKHKQRQTFFSVSQDRRYVRTIPELRGQAIWASHNKWLVISDFNLNDWSLLNLVSMERIQLPPMQSKNHTLCVLLSSPGSPNCKIVFFDIYRNNGSPLFVCKPGDAKFDEIEVDDGEKLDEEDPDNMKGFWESAIAFNGDIYLVTCSFNLFVVDFSSPKPRTVEIIHQDIWRHGLPLNIVDYTPWLVESNGELLMIKMLLYGHSVKEVYGFIVQRCDFTSKSWVDMKSIGKTRAIFLDTNRAMSSSVVTLTGESGLKGDSIYFIKRDDRCLHFYDIEKKTFSFYLPCPDVSRPYSEEFHSSRRRRSEFHWIAIPDERK